MKKALCLAIATAGLTLPMASPAAVAANKQAARGFDIIVTGSQHDFVGIGSLQGTENGVVMVQAPIDPWPGLFKKAGDPDSQHINKLVDRGSAIITSMGPEGGDSRKLTAEASFIFRDRIAYHLRDGKSRLAQRHVYFETIPVDV